MAKKACWLLEVHVSSERETFPSSFYHDNTVGKKTVPMFGYFEEIDLQKNK